MCLYQVARLLERLEQLLNKPAFRYGEPFTLESRRNGKLQFQTNVAGHEYTVRIKVLQLFKSTVRGQQYSTLVTDADGRGRVVNFEAYAPHVRCDTLGKIVVLMQRYGRGRIPEGMSGWAIKKRAVDEIQEPEQDLAEDPQEELGGGGAEVEDDDDDVAGENQQANDDEAPDQPQTPAHTNRKPRTQMNLSPNDVRALHVGRMIADLSGRSAASLAEDVNFIVAAHDAARTPQQSRRAKRRIE